MTGHCLKGIATTALVLAASACGSNMNVTVGDKAGVPLANLDSSSPAPTRLVLASPDKVVISEGDALAIRVSGDASAVDALRFNLENGTLGIVRAENSRAKGIATVAVTMPPAREFVLAGSGGIEAPTMDTAAEVNIAGSGNVAVAKFAAARLSVNVMGSGTLAAAGTAERLALKVAGSGTLAGRGLKVGHAEINIAGSGGGEIASNGKVSANIAGSGVVTVFGRADCRIRAMGSGKLRCRDADPSWDENTAKASAAPLAAKAPPVARTPDPAQ